MATVKMKHRSSPGGGISKTTLLLVLAVVVIMPLVRMMTGLRDADFSAVFSGYHFKTALLNSLIYTTASTVISVALAYLLAICTVRVDIRCKRLFSVLLTLPMLIPSISHGTGLIVLFGTNGIITNLLGLGGKSYIYGAPGIILGSIMYAFPVAYIMLSDVLRYEDLSVYEAADILGISRGRAFLRISLPYMKKPLLAAAFSTFAMIVTDYGVPLRIGGQEKTLSSLMYETAIGRSELGQGAVYGLILLLPAILSFVIDLFSQEKASMSFVKSGAQRRNSPLQRALSYAFCLFMVIFSLLPIAAFVLMSVVENYPNRMNLTTANYAYILKGDGLQYLFVSLLVALLTALVGTAIGFFAAYLTARMKSPASRILHLLSICSMAVPGMVLGISYLMTFVSTPLYGTLILLVMVNTAHFLASPYLMMYNSFGKMNENLEAVGSTLGISRLRMLGRVFLPQSFATLAEMFSYLFVNSMMTISAVAFLASKPSLPISLLIKELERGANVGRIAVVSLLILAVNILIKLAVERVKFVIARRRMEK